MDGAQFAGIVRAILAALGGYLVGQGMLDQTMAEQVGGALTVLATAGWSWFSKRK